MDFFEDLITKLNSLHGVKVVNDVVMMKNYHDKWVPISTYYSVPAIRSKYKLEVNYQSLEIKFIGVDSDFTLCVSECWPARIQRLRGFALHKFDTDQILGVIDINSGKYVNFPKTAYNENNINYYDESFNFIASGNVIRVAITEFNAIEQQVCIINNRHILETTKQVELSKENTIIIGDQPAFMLFKNEDTMYLQNEHTNIELNHVDFYRIEHKLIDGQIVCGNYNIDTTGRHYGSIYKVNDVWFGHIWGLTFHTLIYPRMIGSGTKTKAAIRLADDE